MEWQFLGALREIYRGIPSTFFVVHFILVELQHMNTMHIPLGRMSSSIVWLVSRFYIKRLSLLAISSSIHGSWKTTTFYFTPIRKSAEKSAIFQPTMPVSKRAKRTINSPLPRLPPQFSQKMQLPPCAKNKTTRGMPV